MHYRFASRSGSYNIGGQNGSQGSERGKRSETPANADSATATGRVNFGIAYSSLPVAGRCQDDSDYRSKKCKVLYYAYMWLSTRSPSSIAFDLGLSVRLDHCAGLDLILGSATWQVSIYTTVRTQDYKTDFL